MFSFCSRVQISTTVVLSAALHSHVTAQFQFQKNHLQPKTHGMFGSLPAVWSVEDEITF